MKSLSASEMLNVWEQGLNRPHLQKTLLLLATAFPELTIDAIAELSIGTRDACLLFVRERLFGPRLVSNAVCPCCAGKIEWEQSVADFVVSGGEQPVSPGAFVFEKEGYRLCFRLPNSLDMAVLDGCESAHALLTLLRQCIQSAEYAGVPCAIEKLPEAVIQSLSERIEAMDPQADVRIQLTCPDCAYGWEVFFDIASFLWAEIDAWAERMLQAIHKLAKTYGWSERDILNLSPARRQLYLGMAG
jgi:hypothetical protein